MIENKNNNYNMRQIFNFESALSNPIYIDENYLRDDEICGICQKSYSGTLLFFLIKYNKKIEQNNDKIINKDDNKIEFKKNIKKFISDIPLLLFKNNKEDNSATNQRSKKYYGIELIQNELEKIQKRNIFARKKIVKEELEKNSDKKDIKEQYIYLLYLLINDNTNKVLIIRYLTLLKNNNAELKMIFNDNFEEYKDELIYYSKFISKEEMSSNFELKIKTQKEELIDLLKQFSDLNIDNENDIKKFENYLKLYSESFEIISYNNVPIDFSNEQLFYYRNINIIKYYFKTLYNIINKNLEKIEEEIEDEHNMSDIEKNDKIENKKKELLTNKLDIISYNISEFIKAILLLDDPTKINELIISLINSLSKMEFYSCYNYIILPDKDMSILRDNNDKYIINFLKTFRSINVDLKLIKQFYKNILPLNCFKSIYLDLNGKDSYYPFDDKKFTDDFIDANFEIIDIPLQKVLGITDKFTMKTYFRPYMFPVHNTTGINFENMDEIMENGYLVRTGNHETGHNFTNFNYYMKNCTISIESPRKKSLDKIEGGYYVDYALFGKILEKINIAQVLYILNEKNYEKTYLEFQYGFNNIKQENLIVHGTFENMCKNIIIDLNKNTEVNYDSIFIRLNLSSAQETEIDCEIKNDVLGRISSD